MGICRGFGEDVVATLVNISGSSTFEMELADG